MEERSNGSHTSNSKQRRAACAECNGKRKQRALLRNESAEAAAPFRKQRSLLWVVDCTCAGGRCPAERPLRLPHLLSALSGWTASDSHGKRLGSGKGQER
jgi:hypothetical protein